MTRKGRVNTSLMIGAWYGDMLESFTKEPSASYAYTDLESAWEDARGKQDPAKPKLNKKDFTTGWHNGRIERALRRLNDARVRGDDITKAQMAEDLHRLADLYTRQPGQPFESGKS